MRREVRIKPGHGAVQFLQPPFLRHLMQIAVNRAKAQLGSFKI